MYYVYALIDPRSNKPFYIGKGKDNRVLTHEKFQSNCNNQYKDSVIKKILLEYNSIPYEILKSGFDTEDEAYKYEESIIAQIGIDNLTNICDSRRPPRQLGTKRNQITKNKIKENSKKQGFSRTIEYVKQNDLLIFNILSRINKKIRREIVVSDLKITIDLFNKVKRKYTMYVELLNQYTPYHIDKIKITKINGMKQKVFSDHQELLHKMYTLINVGVTRKNIAKTLEISVEFYDRFKGQQDQFNEYVETV